MRGLGKLLVFGICSNICLFANGCMTRTCGQSDCDACWLFGA